MKPIQPIRHRFLFQQDALDLCFQLQVEGVRYKYEPGYNEYFVFEYQEDTNEDLRKAA